MNVLTFLNLISDADKLNSRVEKIMSDRPNYLT